MIFPEGSAAVNAKRAASLLGRLSRLRRGALGTESPGQAIGGRLHDLGPALQGLDGEAPDRAGDAERADGLSGEILHRDRHAADLEIEFAVVERDAAAPDLFDLA